MNSMSALILASDDAQVIDVFEQVLEKRAFRLLVEKNKLQGIWDTLDDNVACLVMDLDLPDDENMAFLKIVKKIKPRLPVVILFSEESSTMIRSLADISVFYRTFKPLRLDEIEQLMLGIEKLIARDKSNRDVAF
ncbi:response regulator [candidate division KSB1 bacterium]|nr:response regulator [candidate division KSB1 bacterium]RQW01171.1 MAG: response regulator [candidate division KSB1 bacterium]